MNLTLIYRLKWHLIKVNRWRRVLFVIWFVKLFKNEMREVEWYEMSQVMVSSIFFISILSWCFQCRIYSNETSHDEKSLFCYVQRINESVIHSEIAMNIFINLWVSTILSNVNVVWSVHSSSATWGLHYQSRKKKSVLQTGQTFFFLTPQDKGHIHILVVLLNMYT